MINHVIHINGEILFQNNIAEDGTGIYISDHSTVMFGESSNVTFSQNLAHGRGAAVFLRNHSICLFNQNSMVMFNYNKATSGGAIYSEDNSNVTFKATYKITFTSNSATEEGGAIYLLDKSHITFAGNTRRTPNYNIIMHYKTSQILGSGIKYSIDNFHTSLGENLNAVFCNNITNYDGAAIYCENNFHKSFEKASTTVFSNNNAYSRGGAICSYNNSDISFEGNTTTVFSINTANIGGAIASNYNSHISFLVNSTTVFSNNTAFTFGGAIDCNNSYISFEGNSFTAFINNTAEINGGAINSFFNSCVSFNGNSVAVFANNNCTPCEGGAICTHISYISFEENCTTVFSNNIAEHGGAIYSYGNSYISFEGNSVTVFKNNNCTPFIGGAIYSFDNSYLSFKENSTIAFINNSVEFKGGAIYSGSNSHILFQGNSVTLFNSNIANDSGGAIYSYDNSEISFDGNSTTEFSNNTAKYGCAIYSQLDSHITFKGDSVLVFSNTKKCDRTLYSDYKSTRICKGKSYAEFTYNVARNILFKNNIQTINATILYIRYSKIIVKGHSNIIFEDHLVKWCADVCLPYPGEAGAMVIDDNGIVWCSNHKAFNCLSDKCYNNCKDLKKKLGSVKNNKVVNITDDVAVLSSVIELNSSNVLIIGHNNPIVVCVNHSGLEIYNSNNLTIEGITWIGCGALETNYIKDISVLAITTSCNVIIQNCSFLYSKGQVITLTRVSGYVNITNCIFMNSNHYKGHGTSIVIVGIIRNESLNVFTVNNCDFSSNKGAMSVLYITEYYLNFIEYAIVYLINSSFHNNEGASIYLSPLHTFHIIGEIWLQNNVAEDGAGIYISGFSTIVFGSNSDIKFINNTVYNNGAAIFINRNSNAIFDHNSKVTFTDNKASRGTIYSKHNSNVMFKATCNVTFSRNSATQYGAAIYSFDNSQVMFTENATVTFKSNYIPFNDPHLQHGGTVLSKSNSNIHFKDNSVIVFNNNSADLGSAVFSIHSSNVVFKDSSRVRFNNNIAHYCGVLTSAILSNITFTDTTKVTYDTNTVSYTLSSNDASSGGTICTFQRSEIIFTEHSLVTLINNKADRGGAVIIFKSNFIMEEYSKVTFDNNFALYSSGGAFVCSNNSYVTIKGYSNVTFNNNKASQNGGAIHSYNMCRITFKENSISSFTNNIARDNGGAIFSSKTSEMFFEGSSTLTFDCNTANNGGVLYSVMSGIIVKNNSTITVTDNKATLNGGALYFDNSNGSFTEFTKIAFYHNRAILGGAILANDHSNITLIGNSMLLFVSNEVTQSGGAGYFNYSSKFIIKGNAMIKFNYNKALEGGGVYIKYKSKFMIKENSTAFFSDNVGTVSGGAVKILNDSSITLKNHINIKFINNNAQYGGAIFLDATAVMVNSSYKNCLNFTNNIAKVLGNSIYQEAAKSYNSSYLSDKLVGISNKFVATPPNELKFYDPAICIDDNNDTQCNDYYVQNIMFGTKIVIPTCVLDYYNQSIDSIHFLIQSEMHPNCFLSGPNQMLFSCDTFEGISIMGNQSLSQSVNFSINIALNIALNSNWKQVSVNLIFELSPCHTGFWQYPKSSTCECYNASDIVFCSGSSSTIKRGYWFGSVTGKPTVTFCPINYCNFTCCETSNGYYHLSPERDNQCRSHRSGAACGSCEEGYTLSFDSVECVHVNECSIGWTILVLTLVVLYWIGIIAAVFSMMHFKVGIGYLYAITYYYSVVDLLLSQNWYHSITLHTTINIMSSIAKIIPQFLGQFCFFTNMRGIDQQFIHYIHPVAISLFLVIITVLARRSHRLSFFISKGIIRVICCLLLLSYTSLATTSLLLMRPLIFHDVNKVYTYVSPDVEYFHGRHLVYGVMVVLFTIVIVIGLPLLLALEPFLNSQINFIRIKPLLDQFQGCYKDKYHCFAAYYMICRLLIITIILMISFNDLIFQYLLIAVCMLMALIHQLFRPYSSTLLNKFDGFILQFLTLVSALPLAKFHNDFEIDYYFIMGMTFILVILPSVVFILMSLMINKEKFGQLLGYCYIKCLHLWQHNDIPQNEIPLIINEGSPEFYNIIDDSKRKNATICDM